MRTDAKITNLAKAFTLWREVTSFHTSQWLVSVAWGPRRQSFMRLSLLAILGAHDGLLPPRLGKDWARSRSDLPGPGYCCSIATLVLDVLVIIEHNSFTSQTKIESP
jgi:hypothetical protein